VTTLAIRFLLAVAYLSAFLTYFQPAPPKQIQRFCTAEPLSSWYPCEWIPEERQA